jgi:hypothetical protein
MLARRRSTELPVDSGAVRRTRSDWGASGRTAGEQHSAQAKQTNGHEVEGVGVLRNLWEPGTPVKRTGFAPCNSRAEWMITRTAAPNTPSAPAVPVPPPDVRLYPPAAWAHGFRKLLRIADLRSQHHPGALPRYLLTPFYARYFGTADNGIRRWRSASPR